MIDKKIIIIASNTENHGVLDNHTHFSKLKNAICGDEMKVYLIVKNNKVVTFKYECESCIYCQASVSLLSRNSKNKSIDKIKDFAKQAKKSFNNKVSFSNDWKDFNNILINDNIARKECLLLPINAAVDALSD
jgi:nitrogen fixation NifU-like protein